MHLPQKQRKAKINLAVDLGFLFVGIDYCVTEIEVPSVVRRIVPSVVR